MRWLLLLPITLAAQERIQPVISVHVAAPLGTLADDVSGHPGFGVGLHAQLGLGERLALRPGFEWTGYRVNDYNLATRFAASVLDADYAEYRVVYRTFRLGADLQIFTQDGRTGAYLVGGLGGVAAAMYYEERYVPAGDRPEQVRLLGTSHWQTRGYVSAGLGYQGRAGGFVEARFCTAPYSGDPDRMRYAGEPLPDRTAGALMFSAGFRF